MAEAALWGENTEAAGSASGPQPLSLPRALLLVGALGALMILGAGIWHLNLHGLLLLAVLLSAGVGRLSGYRWPMLREAMWESLTQAIGPVVLFMLIGMLVASWAQSGTLATLLCFGLEWLHPAYFLPATFVLCTAMALATGSSWSTAATAGVVLMSVGSSLAIPMPWVAGAIVAGATFGDKMSPISDTTNLAALAAGTSLYAHIRRMMPTALLSFALALLGFAWLGRNLHVEAVDTAQLNELLSLLRGGGYVHVAALFPAFLVIGLSLARVPPEPTMVAGIVSASGLAVVLQGVGLDAILSAWGEGFQAHTGSALLDKLLSRGGVQSMMWTISLILIALALGGLLQRLGVLVACTRGIFSRIKRPSTLANFSVVSALVSTALFAESYLAILLNGRLLQQRFEDSELPPSMLSRALEQGATLTTALIPWSTAGAYFATILAVSPVDYAPFAFFNWLEVALALLLARWLVRR